MLRIGLALDGPVCDYDSQLQKWRTGGQPDSLILREEAFWATMPPHKELTDAVDWIKQTSDPEHLPLETWFMVERPEKFKLVTYSWLKRHGFDVKPEQIVMNSIKRFDCRMNHIGYFIDTQREWLDWYRYDGITAIHLRRDVEANKYIAEGDYFEAPNLLAAVQLGYEALLS